MSVPAGSRLALPAPASRRRPRALVAALAVAVVVQLVVLYLPGGQVPDAGFAVPGLDKAVHVAVFTLPACLAAVLGRSARWALPFAVHAPVSECVQHAWVPLRTGDPADVVADLAGVVLGVVAARRLRARPGEPAAGLEVRRRRAYDGPVRSRGRA